jgi:hypothetical protein
MNTTYTLTEGNDALNRALLMMRYDMSKTLDENVILEQPESRFSFGYSPWSKDPNNLRDSMKRQSQYVKDMTEFISGHKHEILQVAALGALLIPVAGPYISLGLDLVDASLYYSEGDNYMAGFSLAFAMIPGAMLIAKIPAVKQIGKKGLIKILKLASNPTSAKTLSKLEQDAVKQISKNSKWISLTSAKEVSKKLAKLVVTKIKLPEFVRMMIKFNIKNAQPKKPKNPKIEKGKVALEAQFEKEKITTVKQFEEAVIQTIATPEDAAERDKLLAQFFKE